MLPDLRALLGAIVAAIALLMASFALVATFRVAQDSRTGLLQADLAQRGRATMLPGIEAGAALLIDRPAPLEANPVPVVEISQAPDIVEEAPQAIAEAPDAPMSVALVAPQAEPAAVPATELLTIVLPAFELPLSDPPMGGPLGQQTATQSQLPPRKAADGTAAANAKIAKNAKRKAERAAAEKARAVRIARIVRERKARRAAQARAKQQSAGSFNNAPFGNSFGNGPFGNGAFGQ